MTIQVIEFRTIYANGKGTDMVLVAPQGESMQSVQTWHRVAKLIPPDEVLDDEAASVQAMRGRWQVIGPRYQAWKTGLEIPEDGTPLAAWQGVTPEQAAALQKQGIRTVEDVRDASDSAVKLWPWPGARKLPELAGKFLDGASVALAQQENAELRERLAALEEMLNGKDEPKRRGRPPKAEAA